MGALGDRQTDVSADTCTSWLLDATNSHVAGGLRAGDLLSSRYRIDTFLAGGGMGQVYSATDTALDVQVALKTIRPEIARNPASLRRFKHARSRGGQRSSGHNRLRSRRRNRAWYDEQRREA